MSRIPHGPPPGPHLPQVVTLAKPVDQRLVEDLEEMLADARAGSITGFAAVVEQADRRVMTIVSGTRSDEFAFIGQLFHLATYIDRKMGERTETK